MIQDPQCIETSENISAGLVDDRNDEGAIVRHLLEQVHQQFRVLAAQSACGFVDQKHPRPTDQLHGNV